MAKIHTSNLSSGGLQGPKGDRGDQGPAGNATPTNTYDILYTTNNGNGTNVKIGDDVWLGDINTSNGLGVKGVEDETKVIIVLGSNKTESLATDSNNLILTSNNDILLASGSNYAYIGSVTIPNRITKWSDTLIYRSTPPAHDHGVAGDKKNTFSYDNVHLFICTSDYVNDATPIWQRINWGNGSW